MFLLIFIAWVVGMTFRLTIEFKLIFTLLSFIFMSIDMNLTDFTSTFKKRWRDDNE